MNFSAFYPSVFLWLDSLKRREKKKTQIVYSGMYVKSELDKSGGVEIGENIVCVSWKYFIRKISF